MLDHPESLLGRLQRGRGDSVRELLRSPIELARQTLVQCLCTEQDPDAAVPYLIDGLWDGSENYRDRCIARCDLSWPGVRERLTELAGMRGSKSANAARRRLEAPHHRVP